MTEKLAIITPALGVRSETFIRRHIQDLCVHQTVAVAVTASQPGAGYWQADCPTLIFDRDLRSLWHRVQRGIHRRLDPSYDDALPATEAFLKRHRVRVILGEFLDASLRWLPVAQTLGIRFFGHAHGYDVSKMLRPPMWQTEYLRDNETDGIITMSHASRDRLLSLGIHPAKIHVVPYGVDVPDRPHASPRERAERTIRCVAVGRMVGKKAPILTLDAFRRAAEACPRLHLDYIGGGELLPAARQFVRAFGLEDRVTLHGAQSSEFVQDTLRQADIFLQHSITDPDTGDEEGLPVAILEAMVEGLPVVSTRHAGIPEEVEEGKTGYLVDEGQTGDMAERLLALAHAPELRKEMGHAGWRRVRNHFTWEQERSELLRLLGLKDSRAR
jgi:glycosyltransferase involved in cell wall biosynthesis